jgi:ubiquinone/menaquinone biosynthesis C-methylase UbiE
VKKLLNVGGSSKAIPLPPQYAGFKHLLLDIDPKVSPDILCDARTLATLTGNQFDAVYCSHNLEHYYRHDVPRVLAGFMHVLKDGGFVNIVVPDIGALMRVSVERGLDIEDVIYESVSGPVIGLDMLYGYGIEIERSGQDFYTHKTGFTEKSLLAILHRAGFQEVFSRVGGFDIDALAFKGRPDQATRALLDI